MSDKTTYYQRNREKKLNRAKEYYETTKKDWEIKQKNMENYPTKKQI